MKTVAAFLLAVLGGNNSPSAEDIKKILASGKSKCEFSVTKAKTQDKLDVYGNNSAFWGFECFELWFAVGAEADDKIELLLSQVKDKDITELISAGREKLASVPCGGGEAVAAAAPADGAAAETKEEKVEEKEDTDDDLGFSLFDWGTMISEKLYSSDQL